MPVKEGQLYKALKEINVTGIISFSAPVSGSFEATIEKGDILKIENGPPEKATAVYASPLQYEEFELRFVPKADRVSKRYSGYAVFLYLEDIDRYFELVSGTSD